MNRDTFSVGIPDIGDLRRKGVSTLSGFSINFRAIQLCECEPAGAFASAMMGYSWLKVLDVKNVLTFSAICDVSFCHKILTMSVGDHLVRTNSMNIEERYPDACLLGRAFAMPELHNDRDITNSVEIIEYHELNVDPQSPRFGSYERTDRLSQPPPVDLEAWSIDLGFAICRWKESHLGSVE